MFTLPVNSPVDGVHSDILRFRSLATVLTSTVDDVTNHLELAADVDDDDGVTLRVDVVELARVRIDINICNASTISPNHVRGGARSVSVVIDDVILVIEVVGRSEDVRVGFGRFAENV